MVSPGRPNRGVDYGVLNGIAHHRVNTEVIARNWDDLLWVAGSLHLGRVAGRNCCDRSCVVVGPQRWFGRWASWDVPPRSQSVRGVVTRLA